MNGNEMTWLPTWRHFLLGESCEGQVSWATSNPRTRNLTSGELRFEAFKIYINCYYYCFPILSTIPTVASNNLVLDWTLWLGRFWGISGWDPSVCKSNWLHVDILRFSLIKLRYIMQIPLKWSVSLLHSWTSTGYFSNSTGSFVPNRRFSPIIGWNSSL